MKALDKTFIYEYNSNGNVASALNVCDHSRAERRDHCNYGMGLLIGNQGFKGGEYSGIRGMVARIYLKNSILTPFQWIFDGIMDSMW